MINSGQRRRVPNWVVMLILLIFVCVMIGVIAWGIKKYKKQKVLKKEAPPNLDDEYMIVPPKIVDPIYAD